MKDGIMLMIGEDGKAAVYDDTYDITIHCESQEEQDRVIHLLKNVLPEQCGSGELVQETDSLVKDLVKVPPTQPRRKKGEWEEIEVIPEAYDIAGVKTWASMMRCNQCGFTTFAIEGHFAQYDFCPSCGADMKTEGNDDN